MSNFMHANLRTLVLAGAVAGGAVAAGAAAAPMAKPAAKAAAMAFTPAQLDLAPGETYPVTLFVPSPTGKHAAASLRLAGDMGVIVKPDSRWAGRVPPWGTKVFPKITADAGASGPARVVATLAPGGSATLSVEVKRPEVRVIPGIHELKIQVTNSLRGRPLKGRVAVSNPDRFLGDITSRLVDVAPGATQEVKIPLPGAAPAESERYAFTVTLQTWAGYREQRTHQLAFPPQRPAVDR